MYQTFRKYLLLTSSILLIATTPLNPLLVIQAEESVPFVWKGQAIDTITSTYPQVEFDFQPADTFLDSIIIKPETLFSHSPIRVENVTNIPEFTTDLVNNQTYRDFSTFSKYYIKYKDRSIEVMSPSIHIDASQNLFQTIHFIETQAQDIAYKSEGSFLKNFTQDPYEMYALSKTIPLSLIADAKADVERAKYYFLLMSKNDADFPEATELLITIENDMNLLVARYETAHSADGLPKVSIHP